MKKWLIFFSAFALVVTICFSSYVYLYRAEFTSAALSKMYGTPVKINRIRVTSTDIELHNVTVYNPSQYSLQPALSLSKVSIKMTPADMIEALIGLTPANIRRISVKDPLVGIELTNAEGTTSNWKDIVTNLQKNAPGGRTYNVREIMLNDLAIDVKHRAVRKHTQHPPSINRLTMREPDNLEPKTLSQVLYWSTKLALEQIGSHIDQPAFTATITAIPCPDSDPEPYKLKS